MAHRPVNLQRISRRGLISSGVLAGVLAASGVPVHARQRGGVLRLGLSGAAATDGWDPRGHRGLFMRVAAQGAAFDTLVEVTAAGELAGSLAESWEPSDAARTWTFALRPGLHFHDGRRVTAADVIASLALHRTGDSPASKILDRIEAMRAPAPHQVQIRLTGPHADFPFLLADPNLTVAPEGRFDDGIGSGPYRVAEFVPGDRLRLTRVADHPCDGREAWFDAVILRAMPDAQMRGAALLAGHVDAVDAPGRVAEIAAARSLRAVEVQGTAALLAVAAPGDDGLLRRGLDRGALAGRLGLLPAAGDHPLAPDHASALQLPAAVPDPRDAAALRQRHGSDLAGLALRQVSGRLTEDWAFAAALSAGGAWEASHGADGALAALLAEARATLDDGARGMLYAQAQRLAASGPGPVVLGHLPHRMAMTDRLQHEGTLGTLLPMDSARAARRWWFG